MVAHALPAKAYVSKSLTAPFSLGSADKADCAFQGRGKFLGDVSQAPPDH